MNSPRKTSHNKALSVDHFSHRASQTIKLISMTVTNNGPLRRTVARLSSDELNVLEKLGQDSATVNLDITLKPVTWIALQKYAHKHECTLAKAVESGLEDSEQVASGIEIRLGDL